MTWIGKLDWWLITRVFTPIANLLGKRYGKSIKDIVSHCAIGMITLIVMATATDFNILRIMLCTVYVGGALNLLFYWAEETDKWPNSLYIMGFFQRCWMLSSLCIYILLDIAVKFSITEMLVDLGWLCWTFGYYFAACPPAPPKQQKLPKGAVTNLA